MTVPVFQRLVNDSWNIYKNIGANSSAQARRRWPEMLSSFRVKYSIFLVFIYGYSFRHSLYTVSVKCLTLK